MRSRTTAARNDRPTTPQRLLRAGSCAVVSAALVATSAPSASAVAGTGRLGGADRYETAVRIAAETYPSQLSGTATTVYVARADDFPDALAAGSLTGGPVLLVPADGAVPQSVRDAVVRLSPSLVVGLGSSSAVPAATLRLLAADAGGTGPGVPWTRYGGADRYATAVTISQAAFPTPFTTGGVVYLATGTNFPDALAAGTLTDGPVLLVPESGTVPAAVTAEIARLAPAEVWVLGGRSVISDDIALQAAGTVPAQRLIGADRYVTAVGVSQRAFPAGATTAYLARSDTFPDALAAGSVTDGPILLVPACNGIPGVVAGELARLGVDRVVALGGVSSVCDSTLQAAAVAADPAPS